MQLTTKNPDIPTRLKQITCSKFWYNDTDLEMLEMKAKKIERVSLNLTS